SRSSTTSRMPASFMKPRWIAQRFAALEIDLTRPILIVISCAGAELAQVAMVSSARWRRLIRGMVCRPLMRALFRFDEITPFRVAIERIAERFKRTYDFAAVAAAHCAHEV